MTIPTMTRSNHAPCLRVENDSMCMWGMSQISMPLCKEYMEQCCDTGARIQHKECINKNVNLCLSTLPMKWHQSRSRDTTWLFECAIPSWVLMHHSTIQKQPHTPLNHHSMVSNKHEQNPCRLHTTEQERINNESHGLQTG